MTECLLILYLIVIIFFTNEYSDKKFNQNLTLGTPKSRKSDTFAEHNYTK